jgi:hypothetical protein
MPDHKTEQTLQIRKNPAMTLGFVVFVPADTSQCQILPASTSYSHSIVNKPFLRFNINGLLVNVDSNTMKTCIVTHVDQGQCDYC